MNATTTVFYADAALLDQGFEGRYEFFGKRLVEGVEAVAKLTTLVRQLVACGDMSYASGYYKFLRDLNSAETQVHCAKLEIDRLNLCKLQGLNWDGE